MNIDYISGFFDADGSITMSRLKSTIFQTSFIFANLIK